MAAPVKRIEEQHLSYLELYFTKKFLSDKTPQGTFVRADELELVHQAFKRAIGSSDVEKVDRWFGKEVTKEATARFWSAYRNALRIKDRPQGELGVNNDLIRFLKRYTGKTDVNEAILSLLPDNVVKEYQQR